MPRTITDVLAGPADQPIADAEVRFSAWRPSRSEPSSVVRGSTSSVTTGESGEFSITLLDGVYQVAIFLPSGVSLYQGKAVITDGAESNLADVLGLSEPISRVIDAAIRDYADFVMLGHEAAGNPHPQYATGGAQDSHSGRTDNPHGVTAAQVGADPAGAAAGAVSGHEAAGNPHPQYATGGAQDSHSGRTDNPHGVTAAQVGADPAGAAAGAVSGHEAAGNPHPQYRRQRIPWKNIALIDDVDVYPILQSDETVVLKVHGSDVPEEPGPDPVFTVQVTELVEGSGVRILHQDSVALKLVIEPAPGVQLLSPLPDGNQSILVSGAGGYVDLYWIAPLLVHVSGTIEPYFPD